MSKEQMVELLNAAMEPGVTSVIINTKDYVYLIYSLDLEKTQWKEVSYTYQGNDIRERELSASKALMYLIEELTRGLPGYFPDAPFIKDQGELSELINKVKES
ncbi:MAG: hypothetical protein GF329_15995 [Candidatus Lokiarchaeota archaeon]|nr:hypothetical protein [Candidatus Lokiarchaeota archaeon]